MTDLRSMAQLDSASFYSSEQWPDVFAQLRQQAPVYWFEGSNLAFWALSKSADVRYVSQNPTLFSSARGIVINDFEALRDYGFVASARCFTSADTLAENASPPMINCDPPLHRKLRGLVSKVFTPRMVSGLEPRIREIVREELNQVSPGQSFEFVEALAVPVPLYVITEMLGVPRSDRPIFKRLTSLIASVSAQGGSSLEGMQQVLAAQQELTNYFEQRLSEREYAPADDLMSGLLAAELDGERLSREHQLTMCNILLSGGNETTRNLISGSVVALSEHPDQRMALAAEPALIESAVDEFLRWVTPVKTFCRTAVADTEIRNQEIKAGDFIVMLYQSAHRDEEVWEAPEVFDVRRRAHVENVAFGWGEHRCLGASLARLEARIFFEEFITRFPEFELTGDPVQTPSFTVNAIESLPLVVAPYK